MYQNMAEVNFLRLDGTGSTTMHEAIIISSIMRGKF